MAGRALRWFDIPVALGLTMIGHFAITRVFGEAGRTIPAAQRTVTLAVLGALGCAFVAMASSYYHNAQPARVALRHGAAGLVVGAVVAVVWSLVAG